MSRKIHVANPNNRLLRREIEHLFSRFGDVRSVELVEGLSERTLASAGVVEMDSDQQGESAIAGLNGTQFRGSALIVGWETPRQSEDIRIPRLFESMNMPDEDEGFDTRSQ